MSRSTPNAYPPCEQCGVPRKLMQVREGDTVRRLCTGCAGKNCGFIESHQQKLERELEKKNDARGLLHPE